MERPTQLGLRMHMHHHAVVLEGDLRLLRIHKARRGRIAPHVVASVRPVEQLRLQRPLQRLRRDLHLNRARHPHTAQRQQPKRGKAPKQTIHRLFRITSQRKGRICPRSIRNRLQRRFLAGNRNHSRLQPIGCHSHCHRARLTPPALHNRHAQPIEGASFGWHGPVHGSSDRHCPPQSPLPARSAQTSPYCPPSAPSVPAHPQSSRSPPQHPARPPRSSRGPRLQQSSPPAPPSRASPSAPRAHPCSPAPQSLPVRTSPSKPDARSSPPAANPGSRHSETTQRYPDCSTPTPQSPGPLCPPSSSAAADGALAPRPTTSCSNTPCLWRSRMCPESQSAS